uniref:30S ribosomal protein S9 n=1 Tax=Nitzschia alba TaxID=2858 RepID=A0A5C0F4Z8_NITAL|nr:30S ribosomal protein S9 [Nitzschia alba]QEI59605.1 30S ribosomal protein S9 [Nitzschia alba]
MVKLNFKKQNIGLGKRKQAVARVFINSGKGNFFINSINGNKYLQFNKMYISIIWEPFKILNLDKKFDIIAFVKGGGLSSQSKSIQLGIAKQLCKLNILNQTKLRIHSFLTCDSRIKERKKYGLKKARKASQYSKR